MYFIVAGMERPDASAAAELHKIIREISRPWEYELGVFDCSNQAAFLYDYLSLKGYKCEIFIGWRPWWRWHSWLIAEKDGKKFWIEVTLKEIVSADYYREYLIVYRGSLSAIKKLSKAFIFFDYSREWEF